MAGHKNLNFKTGEREGILKKDLNLFNTIRNSGLNMKEIAVKAYSKDGNFSKKYTTRLYQHLYNFQDTSDEELELLRNVVKNMAMSILNQIKVSENKADKTKKLTKLLNDMTLDEIDVLLKSRQHS